jgi:hypothetical protein
MTMAFIPRDRMMAVGVEYRGRLWNCTAFFHINEYETTGLIEMRGEIYGVEPKAGETIKVITKPGAGYSPFVVEAEKYNGCNVISNGPVQHDLLALIPGGERLIGDDPAPKLTPREDAEAFVKALQHRTTRLFGQELWGEMVYDITALIERHRREAVEAFLNNNSAHAVMDMARQKDAERRQARRPCVMDDCEEPSCDSTDGLCVFCYAKRLSAEIMAHNKAHVLALKKWYFPGGTLSVKVTVGVDPAIPGKHAADSFVAMINSTEEIVAYILMPLPQIGEDIEYSNGFGRQRGRVTRYVDATHVAVVQSGPTTTMAVYGENDTPPTVVPGEYQPHVCDYQMLFTSKACRVCGRPEPTDA